MAIIGTQLAAVLGGIVGVNSDPQQPNAGGGGGSAGIDLSGLSTTADSTFTLPAVPTGLFISPSGLNMIVHSKNGFIYGWDLATPFDPATATNQKVSPQIHATQGEALWVSSDGLNLTTIFGQFTDRLEAYTMSTAWDVTTLSSVQGTYGMAGDGVTAPMGMDFSDDGMNVFVIELPANYKVNQFALTTAFDITTASFVGEFDHAVATGSAYLVDVWVKGNQIFLNGQATSTYELSWDGTDVSSGATALVDSYPYTSAFAAPKGLFITPEYLFYCTSSGTNAVARHAL